MMKINDERDLEVAKLDLWRALEAESSGYAGVAQQVYVEDILGGLEGAKEILMKNHEPNNLKLQTKKKQMKTK